MAPDSDVEEPVDQDVGVPPDGRGEVGVQRDIEGVVVIVMRLVQTSAEVARQLHGLGAEARHSRQLILVPRGLDPLNALRERRGRQT